jgi:2-polyprenyl-6-methoxyphenol hydroxylase-like FAD-dependent oxidoreductase
MGRADLPVIVVGAGPTGMTAAANLARHRVPVVVIEAEPVVRTDWRASTFHAATLELLEPLCSGACAAATGSSCASAAG